LFGFAIEKRYRNGNPTRDVKSFSKTENVKKRRRLYSKDELRAIFVNGKRDTEWQKWSPLLGLYAGVRITESIQLRPDDVSDEFSVWHIIIRPGRGQRVKGDRARVIPVHKELVRLGFIELAKRAKREKREWLFKDVPLVEKKGVDFNAPDLEKIMVPSQNAATQWFGRYSTNCGVPDPNVDFHAIRGLFITTGSQMGKVLSLRMELSGHSKGSGVHSTYIYAGASLKSLKAEIDQVRYPIRIPK
jgi:integrase